MVKQRWLVPLTGAVRAALDATDPPAPHVVDDESRLAVIEIDPTTFDVVLNVPLLCLSLDNASELGLALLEASKVAGPLRAALHSRNESKRLACCDCGVVKNSTDGHMVPDWERGGFAFLCFACEPKS